MSRNKLAGVTAACTIAIIVVIVLVIPPLLRTPTTTHTLGVSVSPSGAGSVSPSGGQYTSGAQVTLTASPASGYSFDYWSGSASGTTLSITVTMDSDKSITANFKSTGTITDPIGAVWDYLFNLADNGGNITFYDLLRANVYRADSMSYSQFLSLYQSGVYTTNWWDYPTDSYYVSVFVFVDTSLSLYRSTCYSTIESSDAYPNGRLVDWFSYIVYGDGSIHTPNGRALYYESILEDSPIVNPPCKSS